MPKNYRLKKAADIGFVAPDLFDQLMTGALNVAVQVASHDVRAMVAAAQSVDQSHKLTKAMLAESHQKQQTAAAASAPSLFTRDEGGIRSERGNEIYFLGIIDILTEYNLKKKIESGLKSLKYNRVLSARHSLHTIAIRRYVCMHVCDPLPPFSTTFLRWIQRFTRPDSASSSRMHSDSGSSPSSH